MAPKLSASTPVLAALCFTCAATCPVDTGRLVTPGAVHPCDELVAEVCGGRGDCGDDAWCSAATLLQESDQDGARCQAALESETAYPACPDAPGWQPEVVRGSSCAALLDHVCGLADDRELRPCDPSPACINARLLAEAALRPVDAGELGDGSVTPDQICVAAMDERALYPRCEL